MVNACLVILLFLLFFIEYDTKFDMSSGSESQTGQYMYM